MLAFLLKYYILIEVTCRINYSIIDICFFKDNVIFMCNFVNLDSKSFLKLQFFYILNFNEYFDT